MLLYSRKAKLGEMKNNFKEFEKELYSKECIAECINFSISQASNENINLIVYKRIACNLATNTCKR